MLELREVGIEGFSRLCGGKLLWVMSMWGNSLVFARIGLRAFCLGLRCSVAAKQSSRAFRCGFGV